jgi:hypothetical protein
MVKAVSLVTWFQLVWDLKSELMLCSFLVVLEMSQVHPKNSKEQIFITRC